MKFSLDEIDRIAEKVVAEMLQSDIKVYLFDGEMGAGKTTFIKALCKALGTEEVVNSPTFSIVNEYETRGGNTIFHFDFYRVNSAEVAQNFGCEEYFYSGNFCFVEWPDIVAPLLPDNCRTIRIRKNDDLTRTVEII